MANISISFGPGNSVSRNINHTRDIGRDVYQFLGASPENTQLLVDGTPYEGPLYEGQEVKITSLANKKN